MTQALPPRTVVANQQVLGRNPVQRPSSDDGTMSRTEGSPVRSEHERNDRALIRNRDRIETSKRTGEKKEEHRLGIEKWSCLHSAGTTRKLTWSISSGQDAATRQPARPMIRFGELKNLLLSRVAHI